jgi:hypothetical protein
MDVNPYESPREFGYHRPRQRSGWWDFLACVATAVLIHAVIQAAVHTYRVLGLDWTTRFAPWRGVLLALLQVVFIAYVAFVFFCLARQRWRRPKRESN